MKPRQWLIDLRKRNRISQLLLATASEINPGVLNRIERGKMEPLRSHVDRLKAGFRKILAEEKKSFDSVIEANCKGVKK